jgi:nicotinamidase-related amidase
MPHPLVEVDDSLLLVIDVQAAFLDRLPPHDRQGLLSRIAWLIGVANYLHVPVVATAEDVVRLGGVDPAISRTLDPGVVVHDKMIFGLADDPAILAEVERTGRRTAVLLGLETDVCVAQSAVGLLEKGYRVVAVADATGSPGEAHVFGLQRIRDAGGLVLGVKGLFYEWVRTVERARQLRAECAHLGVPEGVDL